MSPYVKRFLAFLAIASIVAQVMGISNCPTICGNTECKKGEACVFVDKICVVNLPCTPQTQVCRDTLPCGPDTTECKLDCSMIPELKFHCELVFPLGCKNRTQICMPDNCGM